MACYNAQILAILILDWDAVVVIRRYDDFIHVKCIISERLSINGAVAVNMGE